MAAAFAVALLAAAITWLAASSRATQNEDFIRVGPGAYAVATPEPVPAFRLHTHDRHTFDNASLVGPWTFMVFGYTHCPDFCPTTLAVLDEVDRELRGRVLGSSVRFVMVSVDPERDTPERLRQYVAAFNPGFVGVTGDAAEIARLGDSLGIVHAKVPEPTGDYLVDHSSSVLLIDPQGRLHGVFAAPHVARDLVAGLVAIDRRARQTR